ncbi:GDSL-type esterase/lipase family protein [Spirosoma areae]
MRKTIKWVALGLVTLVVLNGLLKPFFGIGTLRMDEEGEENDIKVACVGDSITYGAFLFNWFANAFPKQLGHLLGDGYWVKNFGFSGRTAMKTGNSPYLNTNIHQESLAFQPAIVVIMLGTNDAKDKNWKGARAFKQQYGQLIATYQALPTKPRIYICTPAKAYRHAVTDDEIRNVYIDQEIKVIHELVAQRNLTLIDVNQLTAQHPEWFSLDGIHPNAAGAKAIAQLVCKTIRDTIVVST